MTEVLERPSHEIERFALQERLGDIDGDPEALEELIEELYTGESENPHILYAAGAHLTSLKYLDRRDEYERQVLPERADAGRAFTSYARLLRMLAEERDTPRYSNNSRIRQRLIGMQEELAFLAVLAFATSEGGDFVTLPTPARIDFNGAREASDIRTFFPEVEGLEPLDIQVTTDPNGKVAKGQTYHPRIPVLSLAIALNGTDNATNIRTLLRDIGDRDEQPSGSIKVPRRERAQLLDAASAILYAAQSWKAAA